MYVTCVVFLNPPHCYYYSHFRYKENEVQAGQSYHPRSYPSGELILKQTRFSVCASGGPCYIFVHVKTNFEKELEKGQVLSVRPGWGEKSAREARPWCSPADHRQSPGTPATDKVTLWLQCIGTNSIKATSSSCLSLSTDKSKATVQVTKHQTSSLENMNHTWFF